MRLLYVAAPMPEKRNSAEDVHARLREEAEVTMADRRRFSTVAAARLKHCVGHLKQRFWFGPRRD